MTFTLHAVKSISNAQRIVGRRLSTEAPHYRPLATALSDVMAPSEFEQRSSNRRTNEWSGKLSFASPESDFIGQETRRKSTVGFMPVDDIEYESSITNYATALSDAMAPSRFEQEQSSNHIDESLSWSREMSYAAPESDFTACHPHEYLVRSMPHDEDEFRSSMAYSLSYAAPESDFSSLPLTDSMRAQLRHAEERQPLMKQEQHQSQPLKQPTTLPRSYQDYVQHQQDFPEALVITEHEFPFRIVSVNAPWERLCGYSQDECVGDTLGILQGPDTDKAKVTALLDRLVSFENNDDDVDDDLTMELVNYDKHRRRFTNRLTMRPLKDPQTQRTTHFCGMLQDVSHRYPIAEGEVLYM